MHIKLYGLLASYLPNRDNIYTYFLLLQSNRLTFESCGIYLLVVVMHGENSSLDDLKAILRVDLGYTMKKKWYCQS